MVALVALHQTGVGRALSIVRLDAHNNSVSLSLCPGDARLAMPDAWLSHLWPILSPRSSACAKSNGQRDASTAPTEAPGWGRWVKLRANGRASALVTTTNLHKKSKKKPTKQTIGDTQRKTANGR